MPQVPNDRRRAGARRRFALLALPVAVIGVAGCERVAARSADSAGQRIALAGAAAPGGTLVGRYLGDGTAPLDYTPPSDSEIPNDSLGAAIRRGRALMDHTTDSLPQYAPGALQCSSCHIDAGRRRDAAALIGVTSRFPKYMDRTGAVISVQDRVNYCFTRSLAGTRIPTDSREMTDIVAYLSFISSGVPSGMHVKGEAMPKMARLTGDTTRGARLFAAQCAVCHRADGQGAPPVIPALWGPASYSIGASMAREERAATFIRHFMPLSNPGSLTDQQAFDLSAYVNSHARPDSPQKEKDWPVGGAPYDVPYNTVGHTAYHPPASLHARANPQGAVVPPPAPLPRHAASRG